jgi:hypothetical protein
MVTLVWRTGRARYGGVRPSISPVRVTLAQLATLLTSHMPGRPGTASSRSGVYFV